MRIQKGIYGTVKETPFGKLTPNADEIMAGLLFRNDDDVIGYFTGPALLNTLGLCSLIPKETNHCRRRLPNSVAIRIYKPVDIVNDDNAPYLQIIKVFTALLFRIHENTNIRPDVLKISN